MGTRSKGRTLAFPFSGTFTFDIDVQEGETEENLADLVDYYRGEAESELQGLMGVHQWDVGEVEESDR